MVCSKSPLHLRAWCIGRSAYKYWACAEIYCHAETVTDPAFLVTRTMEDFVTWVDTSKIRRKITKYNDMLDDYELLG